jgi:imidazole glycerol phosphate synthase glutamine amidotransferase subunit
MQSPDVAIVRTGTANLASVCAGFRRLGSQPRITESPFEVDRADRVVLPGVGTFGAAMHRLRAAGLDNTLRDRIRSGRPTLMVCLGLQLLCESSDESPGVRGLGVVPDNITRFTGNLRIPQLGWNSITADPACRLLQTGHAYFANSFRLRNAPKGWSAAKADHGGEFIAAMECGPLLACQFHPELSGDWGLALLRRWLEQRNGAPC